MTHSEFLVLLQGFRPGIKTPKAPSMGAVWANVVAGYSVPQVKQALDLWFSDNDKLPTPFALKAILTKHERNKPGKRPEHVPEVYKEACWACLHEARASLPHDGGLLFHKQDDGRYYAARCPVCLGPHWAMDGHHKLPTPTEQNFKDGKWLPFTKTEGYAIMREARAKGLHPDHKNPYWQWLQKAIANTKAHMNAMAAREGE